MKNIYDKLASRGAGALSDKELLAVLTDDLRMAETLFDAAGGSLARLASEDLARLRMLGGLGLQRARLVCAAAEFGRRVAASQAQGLDSLVSTMDAVKLFRPQLEKLDHEECWALYLNASNRILDRRRVSQGGLMATIVDYRLVVKQALELLATRIVLVHNHPAGPAAPSDDDRTLTERLSRAAALFDIELIDHIIISREGHFSFHLAHML